MATNWDLYNTRLTIRGTTQRERTINDFQDIKNQKGLNSPSCKTVLINDVEKQVFINSTTKKNIKSISPVLNTDSLILGSKIYWKNKYWLLNDLNADDDVLVDGQIQLCNYTLPFQTNSPTIYNEPCIVLTQSDSLSGEDKGNIITIPDTQRVIYIQYNERTKYLVEGKRIFIDQLTDNPKVYHISKVDRICYVDGSNGLWKLTCDEDAYDKALDNLSLKIANYIAEPTPIPTPTPSVDYVCKITDTKTPFTEYNNTTNIASVKVGGTMKPFMCHFFDGNNAEVQLTPVWSLDVSGLSTEQQIKIHLDVTTYSATYPLRAYVYADSDNSLIGKTFMLNLSTQDGLYHTSIPVKVVSL